MQGSQAGLGSVHMQGSQSGLGSKRSGSLSRQESGASVQSPYQASKGTAAGTLLIWSNAETAVVLLYPGSSHASGVCSMTCMASFNICTICI